MAQSPSWTANRFAASQEIPQISRNPKVHYRTRNRPPPVSILGQPNPVHIPTSHLLVIHPNIIHPSTPRSPHWSLSLRFPHQDLLTYLLTYLITYLLSYLLTYLLTYSTVQIPSWEANRFAVSQEIPRISPNPKVHYRTHKRPPPVSILGQPNPVHIPTSHLLEIHPNIIHPSTPRSPHWSLSLRFTHQDPLNSPLLTHTRNMPNPSHSSRFYHPQNIGWGVQII